MNILIAEDDKSIQQSLLEFLTTIDYRVVICDNGREALEILKKEKIHCVLSDIQMPHMDGHELLSRIKNNKLWQDIAVILFTGHGNVKSAVDAMKNGAYDYLLKPVDIKELTIVLERLKEFLAIKEENRELTEKFEDRVKEETNDIKKELSEMRKAYAKIVGVSEIGMFSETLRQIFRKADRIHGNRDIPVIIEGETGTGKEILARYIHYGKGKVVTPFVGINCSAISPNLFESEFFGYTGGAFTGAKASGQKGKLELAEGGTIFLDEITDLAFEYQAKLLRVIQEREYYRVGGLKKYTVDVRFLCSTNQEMKQKVEEGKFREDLYYRLNVAHILLPPLRERKEEILPMARMFLKQLYDSQKTLLTKISSKAVTILEDYPWKGNIRELKSAIDRVALFWDDTEIRPEHLDFLIEADTNIKRRATISTVVSAENIILPESNFNLKNLNLEIVKKVLDKHQWNKAKSARYLGTSRDELYTYVKRLSN